MEYNIELQHQKGKLHAIERIEKLLDKNSFYEINHSMGQENIPYDGVITGYGYIEGILVFVYAQDFTVKGGTVGKKHARKIARVLNLAIENRAPVIWINDSGGARIQEGVNALSGYGEIFYLNTRASGYIPQISIIAGPCAGGAVYSPGITDFIFMIKEKSSMYVTGPRVVEQATGKKCDAQSLGGAIVHSQSSGVVHANFDDENQCFLETRKLICLLENRNRKIINKYCKKFYQDFQKHVPTNSRKTYDIHLVIETLLDQSSFYEIQKEFAPNAVIGFGVLSGITIGIVANQPLHCAGVLDCDASDKIARFIRFCDAFNIPIVTLVDVPGFMPSVDEEEKGIIRHGAKILFAYAEATVTKITVVIRKAYGGAYIAMGSKELGADIVLAWPTAEIAVMGAEAAVDILYHKEVDNKIRQKKVEEYTYEFINNKMALKEGYIDKEIEPNNMRKEIFDALNMLKNKKDLKKIPKKHGNIPL